MRETLNEYLTFSKKERTGILVLMSVVIVIAVAPAFYRPKNFGGGDSTAIHEFRDQIVLLDAGDNNSNNIDSISSPSLYKYRKDDKYRKDGYYQNDGHQSTDGKYRNDRKYQSDTRSGYYGKNQNDVKKAVVFDFDPNTITTDVWIKLGVSERTAVSIEKYLAKGGRFRKAEDLLRIYGMSEQDKKRLLPFVKIAADDTGHKRIETVNSNKYNRKIPVNIDINTADTVAWSSLPGIGPVLSQRIIKYRERLGGFYSIDQVAEVYGLADSVFQKIRPFLTRVGAIRKININMATPDILEQHPYLKRPMARAIVDYRSQHGVFKEIGDLKQVVSITPELFDRLSQYIGL